MAVCARYQNLNVKNFISKSVIIGEAASGERGLSGNTPGDQKGWEVDTGGWAYSSKSNSPNHWQYVFRAKDINARLRIAQAVIDACNNRHVGYDWGWPDRKSFFKEAEKVGFDISKVNVNCECSCSELANVGVAAAGLKGYVSEDQQANVGTLADHLKDSKEFYRYTSSDYVASSSKLIPGDILIGSVHTCTVVKTPKREGMENAVADWSIKNNGKISSSAKDVKTGAVAWAMAISSDNTFHFGKGTSSHLAGCYFCGTQPEAKKNSGMKGWNKTYNSPAFITAAFAHGGGEPTLLGVCKAGGIFSGKAKTEKNATTLIGYDNAPTIFSKVTPFKKKNLQKGDVLCSSSGAVAIYIGGAEIAYASGEDDNKKDSTKWDNSISIVELTDKRFEKYERAYRYIGNGGAQMNVPVYTYSTSGGSGEGTSGGTSSGPGLNLSAGIAQLYSSDNYEYLHKTETRERKNEVKELVSKFNQEIQAALNNLNFTPYESGSAAIPEIIVNEAVDISEFEKDKPKKIKSSKPSRLLSYPTLVEAPTIVLDFNGTKIGGYNNSGDLYPNYITSMKVNKINGRINTYTINLSYQVRYGEDPNFIDKLISKVGYLNPLKILYGDSNYPGAFYREESAIITDVRHSEDTTAYRINYTISAISSIAVSQASYKTFKEKTTKPSTAIYDLLYNSGEISKSLQELFPGMANKNLVASKGLIPSNDSVVNIGGMENVSPLTYLSYLVACMNNSSTTSSYYLCLVDNSIDELGGSYFKINEVKKYNSSISNTYNINSSYFELDIGYPSDNFVMNFQLCNNDYWSLVYKYAGNISKFEYGIDDSGNLIERESNILYKSDKYSEGNLVSSNWWSQVTEFPISAKVVIKGLISSAILMSYIKVNALFYGLNDIASGLYVVTAQEDYVSGSGYTTELTLLRVAGE